MLIEIVNAEVICSVVILKLLCFLWAHVLAVKEYSCSACWEVQETFLIKLNKL